MKMTDFMLKSTIFEFDCKFYQQISAIDDILFIWTDSAANLITFLKRS